MKYKIDKVENHITSSVAVTVTADEENFVNFPSEPGNPNYDAFLVQANLTDAQVQKLKTDTWYDFPKEVAN